MHALDDRGWRRPAGVSISTMQNRRLHWLLGVLACVVVGALAWMAVTPLDADSNEQVYVIPKGTFARRMAGEQFEPLPSEIRLTLGVKDVLVLRNEDDVPHLFGPVLIMPDQSFKLPFRKASTYQFMCQLHAKGTLDIIVEATPEPGWPRLKWRAAALARSAAWL
jgi:hypothetical protein